MAIFVAKMVAPSLAAIAVEMVIKLHERKKREETRKVMECEIDEALQELKNKMEVLQENFNKLEGFRQSVHQLLRADLENNQGKKEENLARVLLSSMEWEIQVLSQRIQALEKEIQEWPESTKYELHLLRAELENNQGKKEEEISRALESRINLKSRQLFQIIETLKEYLKELLESSQHEFQLLRANVEK